MSTRPRWLLVASLAVAALAGCGLLEEPVAETAKPVASASVAQGSGASAGPSEPSAPGPWIVLFDGTSTDALRGYGMAAFPTERWLVADGELRTIPGAGTDLVTRETYADFELEFEWRVAPGGNSGVLYRVAETGEPAWTSGPEYQVLDDEQHPDGREPTTAAGALYALLAPGDGKRLEPVGAFNSGRIVVRDGHVEHWLNGQLVVDYGWDDAALRDLVAASKFARYDGFLRQPSGFVVFQHHGEEAAFRSIRIRALEP